MTKIPSARLFTIPAAVALATAVAACGSSSSGKKVAGLQQIPASGQTVASGTTAATTSSTTPTTATSTAPAVKTPTSGPLSKEPTITVPKTKAPTKLVVKDLIKGTGTAATSSSIVHVNYVGALYSNGKVFDASWTDGTGPLTATLSATQTASATTVIPGWQKGLVGMKVGGRRELIIPPSLAYGAQASGSIPANSTLIFIIDLLKVS